MASASLGLVSLLIIVPSSTIGSQVRFLISLQLWILVKAATSRSMKSCSSDGQQFYLWIYGVKGRRNFRLGSMVHAGWTGRSEYWPSLQRLPVFPYLLRQPTPELLRLSAHHLNPLIFLFALPLKPYFYFLCWS
ncbi:hypothetical protein V6N13_029729 [Hibiscus sabdariffa]|uniref:Secreted protein n=1 Tax=Hibiscus sabdariffa TaxID=183260 RepID=A0ABR2T9F4_9ROSI